MSEAAWRAELGFVDSIWPKIKEAIDGSIFAVDTSSPGVEGALKVAADIALTKWREAHAVSLPDRETLAKVAGMIRCNCTPSTEAYQRGGDALIYAGADWVENPPEWVLATLPTKLEAGETEDALADLRQSIEEELELGGDASTLVPAVTEWLKRTSSPAPLTINREALIEAFRKTRCIATPKLERGYCCPVPEEAGRMADAVIAHLSAQTVSVPEIPDNSAQTAEGKVGGYYDDPHGPGCSCGHGEWVKR